jgi:hypothetical protein
MYRPLVIAALLCGLSQPLPAAASEYAGLGRLAHAGLPRDPAPFPASPAVSAAGPLRPFLQLDGEAGSGNVDALAAGLRLDGSDWQFTGELTTRPRPDGLEPILRLASTWRLGRFWQLSTQLASLPLDETAAVTAGRVRLAARRTGQKGAWDEFSLDRRASRRGWSDDLILAAHRPVLAGPAEQISVTGRFVSREVADADQQTLSLGLNHRWEAWNRADLRVEQRLSVGVAGHRADTRMEPAGRLRYAHMWEFGHRLDVEYAIERETRSGPAPDDNGTRLSVGVTGRF